MFELSPGNGGWSYTEIYPLPGTGWGPYERLVMDGSGNLYGTMYEGSYSGYGSVFKFTPSEWRLDLHRRYTSLPVAMMGQIPMRALILDSSGNLYGTARRQRPAMVQGTFNYGVVFEITPLAEILRIHRAVGDTSS